MQAHAPECMRPLETVRLAEAEAHTSLAPPCARRCCPEPRETRTLLPVEPATMLAAALVSAALVGLVRAQDIPAVASPTDLALVSAQYENSGFSQGGSVHLRTHRVCLSRCTLDAMATRPICLSRDTPLT